MDSNHRRRKPADLQSAPVGHLGNLPTVPKLGECRLSQSSARVSSSKFSTWKMSREGREENEGKTFVSIITVAGFERKVFRKIFLRVFASLR
jgi:hypothetical protein